ncbi:hypothetical protein KUTeg_002270 [Tegillarca granosa]|uniref:Elongation factor Ts, mitochondrial n=1 Tax=Tegillarca granosa TaxID=220873 RepID=A0ABQ9FYB1_TEGGR|nr:hypothetical protein KUTeg_002270 [Tegillarca granosa]
MIASRFRFTTTNFVAIFSRAYCSAVDKNFLSKLRKKTGYPLLKCKKALQQFDNDLVQAEKWLREQAQKEGWSMATKLGDRPMSQGLLNCETDFVARNDKFKDLMARLSSVCEKHFTERNEKRVDLNKADVGSLKNEEDKTLSDLVALEIGSIGENMAVRRACYMQVDEGNTLGTYVHPAGTNINIDGCEMGRFVCAVEITNSSEELNNLANDLAQHIVGMKALEIGKPDDKPAKKNDDETKLIFQDWLIDPSVKVGEVLKDHNTESI